MTADHGRRALPWYDRRQPALLAAAARRRGLHTTPRVGTFLEVLDSSGRVVACARFTTRGTLVRAWALTATGKRVDWQVSGFGTAREVLDLVTGWFDLGRPDRLPKGQPYPAIDVTTTPEREHLAEVLPFRPRKHS